MKQLNKIHISILVILSIIVASILILDPFHVDDKRSVASKTDNFVPDEHILSLPMGYEVLNARNLSRKSSELALEALEALEKKNAFNSQPELQAYRLMTLSNIALNNRDSEQVAKYSEQLIDLAEHNNLQWVKAESLVEKSIELFKMGKMRSAQESVQAAIKIANDIRYESLLIKAYNTAGVIANDQSHLVEAQKLFHKGIELGKKYPNHIYNSKLLSNMAVIYIFLEDWEKALEFIPQVEKAYAASDFVEDGVLAILYTNQSLVYFNTKDVVNARISFEKAQRYINSKSTERVQLISLKSHSDLLILEQRYEDALNVLAHCLSHPKIKQYPLQQGQCYQNRAIANQSLGRNGTIIADLEFAIRLFDQISARNWEIQAHKALSEAYLAINNHEKSLQHFQQYYDANKALLFDKRQSELFLVQQFFETQALQQEFELAKSEKNLAAAILQQQQLRNKVVMAFAIVLLIGLTLVLTHARKTKIQNYQLKEVNKKDPLTGLGNRRFLESFISDLSQQETEDIYHLVILDLDNFKQVNDQYGHTVGDKILTETAQRLTSHVEEDELVIRWGGEEFVCLIKGGRQLKARLESIKATISSKQFETDAGNIKVTASFGVNTTLGAHELKHEIDALFDRADQALYRAKALGKDRIEFA